MNQKGEKGQLIPKFFFFLLLTFSLGDGHKRLLSKHLKIISNLELLNGRHIG